MVAFILSWSVTAWAGDPNRIVGDEVHREEHHRKERVFTLTEAERVRRLKDFERMQPIIKAKVRQNFLPGVKEGAPFSAWHKYARTLFDDARTYMVIHLLGTEANQSKYRELESRRSRLFESVYKTYWDSPGESHPETLQAFQVFVNDLYLFFLDLGYQKWHSDQGHDVPAIQPE